MLTLQRGYDHHRRKRYGKVTIMKMTTRGRVTVPHELRRRAGLLPGTEVEFVEAPDRGLYLRRVPRKGRGKEIVARMRGTRTLKMSTDEILALMRGDR